MTIIKLKKIIKSFMSEMKAFKKKVHKKGSREFILQLKCIKDKNRFYMYSKKTKKSVYISAKDSDKIKELAQEYYNDKLEIAAESMLDALEKCLTILDSCQNIEDVYSILPETIKNYVKKESLVTIDVQAWKDKYKDKKNPYLDYNYDRDHKVEAIDGTSVRSKSEALIISVLIALKIPFVYEWPINIEGQWFYPDFIILNTRTGEEFIYEHFGIIDNPEYVEKNLIQKLHYYKKKNIILGKNLLITFETQRSPLTEKEVREFVKTHFM